MLPLWKDSCGGGGPEFRSCPVMHQEGPFWGLDFLVGTFCKPECAMDVDCFHYTWGLMGAAS